MVSVESVLTRTQDNPNLRSRELVDEYFLDPGVLEAFAQWFYCTLPYAYEEYGIAGAPQTSHVPEGWFFSSSRAHDPGKKANYPNKKVQICEDIQYGTKLGSFRLVEETVRADQALLIMHWPRMYVTAHDWRWSIQESDEFAPYPRFEENSGKAVQILKEKAFNKIFLASSVLDGEPIPEEWVSTVYPRTMAPLTFPAEDQCFSQTDGCSGWFCPYLVETDTIGVSGAAVVIPPHALSVGDHDLYLAIRSTDSRIPLVYCSFTLHKITVVEPEA